MNKWTCIKISRSTRENKKYVARLQNKKKDIKEVHFGDTRYEHYRDRTPGDKYYSYLNHNDKERRRLYRSRHKHFIKPGYYSAGYLSWHYLW